MIKLLIICKNMETAKNITNTIVAEFEELRLIGFANNLAEAQKILKDQQPNLIITTNKDILYMLKSSFINYYPAIIFLTDKKYRCIDYKNIIIINPNEKNEFILAKITTFLKNNKSTHREKAIKILSYLGFDFKLSGTVYLLDSILYAHTYKGAYCFEKLERDVYSYVADLNSSNIERVKWSIFRAINYMYRKHNQSSYSIVENYFNLEYPTKPTPKLIISLISNNLDK